MKKIVYCSNTGHTEKYAKMLGEKLNIEVLSFSDVKSISKDTEIIFMSWVFGNNVVDLQKAIERFKIISVIAVGMNSNNEKTVNSLKESNKITLPFYYLQGGVDYNKLKGIKKIIIKMVGKMVAKENKEEDKETIEIFKNGGNFISEDKLDDIIKDGVI